MLKNHLEPNSAANCEQIIQSHNAFVRPDIKLSNKSLAIFGLVCLLVPSAEMKNNFSSSTIFVTYFQGNCHKVVFICFEPHIV